MADLDKELGFCSSQLTEKSEAAKIEEDEDIMKILSSARSRYTKSLVDQDKIVNDLTLKNEQLEADKLQLLAEIDNLNSELELKEESLNRANIQLEEIKVRLSSFEVDSTDQDAINLNHELMQKEDMIKDYELKLNAADLEIQRLTETIKHKDQHISEIQRDSRRW